MEENDAYQMRDHYESLKAALADRYAIVREIGSGGMAIVYLAEDLKHRRKVALKVLRPAVALALGSERFLREIEIAAGLSHPHILGLHDSGEVDGFLYFVMPYVEGETLRDRLTREGRLPVDDAVHIARQVAGALAHAHRNEIIHRDIKPENILLIEGHALVADFGIGKAVCDICDDNITASGTPIGTPAYMSPEQAMGEEVDGRSDVYSLGCVLFELLAGDPPFVAPTAQAVLMRQATEPAPPIAERRPDTPQEIAGIVEKALAKDPDRRFQSAAELASVLGPEGTLATGSLLPPIATHKKPSRQLLTVAAAGVVALAAAGWWFLAGGDAGSVRVESLAVLPLANLSGDSGQDYFVDGMHDALIAEVAQIGALNVISRTSVMKYRGTNRPIAEIAEELGVDAVLEGSVTRFGDSVRVIAQLIALDPERHLWSGSFGRELRNALTVHSEVARAIAREVEAELTPEQAARLAAPRPLDPDVLDIYLEGRFYAAEGSIEGFERAVAAFERVIERADDFAPAYSGLALSLHLLGFFGGLPASEAEPRAILAAEHALDLDPGLAEARAVLAGIRAMHEWDWDAAERQYTEAIELDASSAIARRWYAYHLSAMQRHAKAIAEARRGAEIDPLNALSWFVLGEQYLYARQYDEALSALERALALEPGMEQAIETLEDLYTLMGRYDDAVLARVTRTDDRDAVVLEQRFADGGPSAYWEWRIEHLRQRVAASFVPPRQFAKAFAALSELDSAMVWLERAYEAHDGMELIRVVPFYDSLRDDPRFVALVERMGFPAE
jgi:serine/threonine-protein kinase